MGFTTHSRVERARMKGLCVQLVVFSVVLVGIISRGNGAISSTLMRNIEKINHKGPYLGIVVPNAYELNPLLQSKHFVPDSLFPVLDLEGKRFRVGQVKKKKAIIVMTGLGMVNAGITTQLLLSLFNVEGVVHYGIAGNANPELEIGDVTIPQYWAHSGLWNWQRYGDGPEDELSLESNGDYTREIGYLQFSDFNVENGNEKENNTLNRVWYQPEEIFPVTGTPDVRQHVFWVPVDKAYLALAQKLENMELPACVNATTCLPRQPKVTIVERGLSADVFVDNAAYRQFLRSKFNASPIEMETAAVALISFQQNIPFIAFRALSDLAGGGSAVSNEADLFGALASRNSVDVSIEFIGLLGLPTPRASS